MKIVQTSAFKNPDLDHPAFFNWMTQLEKLNAKTYERLEVQTGLGKTLVWGLNTQSKTETLIIFPGFRTTPLFWDFDNGLADLQKKYRIFLVETNGQPNPSAGASPAIKSLDYGVWAEQVLNGLGIDKAYIAGASFGGLVCMKLCIVAPEKVKAAFLLNPGCLQPFSMKLKNMYYNILPLLMKNERSVKKFLNKAVFCAPEHHLSTDAMQLCVEFELLALNRYKDKTEKPYYMGEELKRVKSPVYLLLGDHDLLFPTEKSIANAKQHIGSLKEVIVFKNVGHGIETYRPAMHQIDELMTNIKD